MESAMQVVDVMRSTHSQWRFYNEKTGGQGKK